MHKQPSLFDQATIDNSFWGFVQREAKRMWPSDTHRSRSLSQSRAFTEFGNTAKRPLSQFLSSDLDDFADHLIAQGKSEATVNRYLASVSKVFNHAVSKRVLKFAPKPNFFKEPEGRVRYFDDAEIELMLSFFNKRGDWWMHDMVLLALKTGMRKGEIVALGQGAATITPCGQWIELPAEVTKTGKARAVAISNALANGAAHRLADNLGSEYTDKRFEYRWGLLKREYARNDDTYVFHVTRHTAASRMANDLAVPTVTIAQALGHSSLQTTQKYVHAKPDTLADISNRM